MSLVRKINGKIRVASESTPLKVKTGGRLRDAYILIIKLNGRLYKLWELIIGYIFTSDGYSLHTKDGYSIKCNDQ